MTINHSSNDNTNNTNNTSNSFPSNIVDVREFDSSIILILRGGIPRFMGDLPECLSQAILEGTMLVGRLGGRTADLSL